MSALAQSGATGWRTRSRVLALVLVVTAGCGGSGTSGGAPTDPGGPGRSAAPAASVPGSGPTGSASSADPAGSAPAGTAPSGGTFDPARVAVELEPFASGLDEPLFITHAGDGTGRLYVVEQAGRIRIVEGDGSVLPEPFLDLSGRITAGGERGLLGLAFHPEHTANGRFFVFFTDQDGANVVAEYGRRDETSADPATERIILSIPDFASNHNGGMLAFGPDGMLFIGTGDGGGAGDPQRNGQATGALLGKILRIDVDGSGPNGEPYAIPPDNPLASTEGARPEIWAVGMRNPWRFSFDHRTGDLFIGDVGQGAFEEIDVMPAGVGGLNFGWSVMEGPSCFREDACDQAGLTPPVASYDREVGGCTVVGGYVYRGAAQPSLGGGYLFGDYCSGQIWALAAADALDDGAATFAEIGRLDGSISSFGEDGAGELYVSDLSGGQVLRVVGTKRSRRHRAAAGAAIRDTRLRCAPCG